ncbi:MAG TPA: Fic family protein [Ideonella sp.]|nr:Fic family protein [Ideonella sp.]
MLAPPPADELDLISALLGLHPAGLGISALQQALAAQGHPLPRRTLQRRLEAGVAAGRLISEGGSRAIVYKRSHRYRPAEASIPLTAEEPLHDHAPARAGGERYVPVSPAGLQVRDAIRQPLMQRRPVGYDRGFLERYRPNHDFYLLPEQRLRLHEAGRTASAARPAGTYARDMLGRLLIDLSWASSRLEGNTYSRLDTQRLIEQGQAAEGKDVAETQMILNHKAAIEMIVENADEAGFNPFTLLNLHAILSDNLMADPLASGRLRTREVAISGTVFMPLAMPQQIAECFELLLGKAAHIADPFEQAFFGMVHLPYLQPFEDVNKRVSRLAANIPLVRHNLCPLSFVEVPGPAYIEGTLGVYELTRVELLRDVFVWAYQRSCERYLAIRQSVGEPDAFRLKYRAALAEVVQDIVRRGLRGTPAEVEDLARELVAAADLGAFGQAVQTELDHLYEGNIARYRLRLSEYGAWRFKRTAAR